MLRRNLTRAALAGLLLAPVPALSADLFTVTITLANSDTGTASFTSISDLLDAIDGQTSISSIVPSYTGNEGLVAQLDLRGVEAIVRYANADDSLTFEVPSLGTSQTFTGANRAASDALLNDYLEENTDDILAQILREMVATTPSDPVAGNPSSLSASMIADDFTLATSGFAGLPEGQGSHFAIGGSFSTSSFAGTDQTILSLPLGYSYTFANGNVLAVSMPLAYVETNGSESYRGALGLAYGIAATPDWMITPALRAGLLYSEDMGSFALVTTAMVTSRYEVSSIGGSAMDLWIGNSLGMVDVSSISSGDYDSAYDLSNTVTRNGVGLTGALGSSGYDWEASLVNSMFFGDDLFIDNYFDAGFSVGRAGALNAGVTLTFTEEEFYGAAVNVGYRF